MEEKRPGEFFPVYEDEKGTYILNSKDMCMIDHIDKLAEQTSHPIRKFERTINAKYERHERERLFDNSISPSAYRKENQYDSDDNVKIIHNYFSFKNVKSGCKITIFLKKFIKFFQNFLFLRFKIIKI
jgi:type III secretory pathway component EscR